MARIIRDGDVWKLCVGVVDGLEKYSPYKVVMMTIPRSGVEVKGKRESCGDFTSCRIMPGSAIANLYHGGRQHVLIDTTLYSLYTDPYRPSDGCELFCFQLDDGDGEPGWKTLPPLHNPDRGSPYLLAWDNQLYVLGRRKDCDFKRGSFGEVFDPKKESWADWPFMEDGRKDDFTTYVVPLGQYGGKLLLTYSDRDEGSVYDFQTQREESFSLFNKDFYACWHFFGDALVVQKDNKKLLCWLNNDGFVVTYDVVDGISLMGRLTGLEDDFDWSDDESYCFTHLEGDMFCIVWADIHSCIGPTTLHAIIVEVKINPCTQELTAKAVSCFKESVSGRFTINDCFTLKV